MARRPSGFSLSIVFSLGNQSGSYEIITICLFFCALSNLLSLIFFHRLVSAKRDGANEGRKPGCQSTGSLVQRRLPPPLLTSSAERIAHHWANSHLALLQLSRMNKKEKPENSPVHPLAPPASEASAPPRKVSYKMNLRLIRKENNYRIKNIFFIKPRTETGCKCFSTFSAWKWAGFQHHI